jgi:serine phosphatase RsbU (regulator of sigma subunit)
VPGELPGDEGVILLPDKDERIGALAYDHEVELISKIAIIHKQSAKRMRLATSRRSAKHQPAGTQETAARIVSRLRARRPEAE